VVLSALPLWLHALNTYRLSSPSILLLFRWLHLEEKLLGPGIQNKKMKLFKRNPAEPLDTVRFATSWILPPSVLFVIRALISLYIFTSIFTTLGLLSNGNEPVEAQHYFSYFTSLTYFGLAFYFLFAAIHTGSYWLTGTPYLTRWPKVLQTMHSIYYSTITTYPFLVTIVYWALIWVRTSRCEPHGGCFQTFYFDHVLILWRPSKNNAKIRSRTFEESTMGSN
jgi:hypothetical protein